MNSMSPIDIDLLYALVRDYEMQEAEHEGREPVFLGHCYICGNHVLLDQQLCYNCVKPVFCEYCHDQYGGCDYCNPKEPELTCTLCGKQFEFWSGAYVCDDCRKANGLQQSGSVTRCADPGCKNLIDGTDDEGGACSTCCDSWDKCFN